MRKKKDPEADLLPLDHDTRERLDYFAAATGKTPGEAAASLLRELLWDNDFWREAAAEHLH